MLKNFGKFNAINLRKWFQAFHKNLKNKFKKSIISKHFTNKLIVDLTKIFKLA
jgi:hypothetical protein